MTLLNAPPVSFIPTTDATAARAFYEGTLGLHFLSDDRFALVFRVGPLPGSMLRVVRVAASQSVAFTIFGWETASIEQTVDDLVAKGVRFLRYAGLEQDERAIWRTPDNGKVAWFQDPDGNTLSLAQHKAEPATPVA